MSESQEFADDPMIVRSVAAGGFVRINRAFAARIGFDTSDLALRPFVEWIEEADRDEFLRAIDGCRPCRVRHTSRDGHSLELDLLIRDHGDGPYVLGIARSRDESPSYTVEDEDAPTVKSTLHQIARIVEEQNPGFRCSILLVEHGRFVSGAGPSLPHDYNCAFDGYPIGPTVGSCGTAVYWNVPVIVEDIQKDPLWQSIAPLAAKAGVAACWSHPFTSNKGGVLGALAFNSKEPRAPTSEELRALRAAAQMTGLAVERGRAEEALRGANQVKERFMANLSHEIRTPLNALIGITDFLSEAQGAGLPRHELKLLRAAGEQLLDLFTGALELTEVADRRAAELQVVDPTECCRRVVDPLSVVAKAKGLRFECLFAYDLPSWIWIDEWAFERCIKLLTDNAVKFTSEGSIRLEIGYERDELTLLVTDTGCGFDLGRLQELRQPFVQGDLSTTKEYAGFGIGLALVDACARAIGGKLEFSSNEPHGTVVRLRVPVRLATPPESIRPVPQPLRVDTDRPILVVEDNALNSRVIEKILTRSGYECHFALNGEEALDALKEREFSCILMDCQMPVMDGFEATRRIRESELGSEKRIPIIAVTANALAGDRDLCIEAGMDDYLAKPVRSKALVSLLEQRVPRPSSPR
ncbi:MAG: response regulator [Planctomycetes bacterium]|nr:response regulator [Planctomycetota bacterium]